MRTSLRIAYTCGAILLALWAPYWLVFLAVIGGFVIFDWYVEGVLVVTLTDLFFGVPLVRFHGITAVGTLIAAVLFALVAYGKRLIRYGTL